MDINKIAGVGGIGTGVLFEMDSNAALGRSESRMAFLSDARDFCKLHIVFHYLAVMAKRSNFVYPIGHVGGDLYGESLLGEMQTAGMDTSFVKTIKEAPTMFSVCFQYPDKEGGNLTSSNSACSYTNPAYVGDCLDALSINENSIVVALPEVNLDTRRRLLQLGHAAGSFTAMSVASAEAGLCIDMLPYCGLLALNTEEALSLSGALGTNCTDSDPYYIAEALYGKISKYNSKIMIIVTCGCKGAVTVENGHIEKVPPFTASPLNTAGAGDACLGGTLAGLVMGLPFQKKRDDSYFGETPLSSALELGSICAGMAIEVKDSIRFDISKESISARIKQEGLKDFFWSAH